MTQNCEHIGYHNSVGGKVTTPKKRKDRIKTNCEKTLHLSRWRKFPVRHKTGSSRRRRVTWKCLRQSGCKMAGVFEVEVDGVEHDHGHGHRDDAAQVGEQLYMLVDEIIKYVITHFRDVERVRG